ncbi:MAG: teichoic acid glycosyl transferase, partial [Candidatus Moranbacteria bacterium]|nr:teichoic acid glycosyl transferase [Candidatus Moranbacteria bacterium]
MTNLLLIFVGGIMGVVNLEKTRQRTEPLYPSDLKMITASKSLLEMVSGQTVATALAFVLICGVFFYFVIHRNIKKQTPKLPKKNRLAILLITSLGLLYIGQFQQQGNLLKRAYEQKSAWIPWSQLDNYYVNGFVAGFLYNLPSDPMEEPIDYSVKKITDLHEKYQAIADEINEDRDKTERDVNVIFVMNESFSDPTELEGINLKVDPIPFVRALADSSYNGEILSPGYGGGTANIEFEALTGFSMEPFS